MENVVGANVRSTSRIVRKGVVGCIADTGEEGRYRLGRCETPVWFVVVVGIFVLRYAASLPCKSRITRMVSPFITAFIIHIYHIIGQRSSLRVWK